MALKIRLARGGSKSDPHYSVVVIRSTQARDASYIAKVGHYHPRLKKGTEGRVVLDLEALKYWLSVGALPTEIVVKLLADTSLKDTIAHLIPDIKQNKFHGMSKKDVAKKIKEDAVALAEAKKKKAEEAKKLAEAKKLSDSSAEA